MVQVTDLSSGSARRDIRDATASEIAKRFPGVHAASVGFALVAGADAALACAPEPFDSEALALSIARIVHASAPSTAVYQQLFAEAGRRAADQRHDQVLRRTSLQNLQEIWALEHSGFALMDVGVTFALRLDDEIEPVSYEDLLIRASTDDDIREIADLMVREPWGSRYESDPAYEPSRVRELRSRWLWNSHRGRADLVVVGLLEGRPAGYVTCRLDRHADEGEIELVGTLPGFRGRHVASRLIGYSIAWFSTRTRLVTVRTQATNVAAARLYESAGFTLHSSDLTFRLAVPRRTGGAV
jgi:ribosomal protein S18 acetylase RimI-like enzyme